MEFYVPEAVLRQLIETVVVCSALLSISATFLEVIVMACRERSIRLDWPGILTRWLALLAFSIPIALAAYVAGYLSTMSRTTAVGNLLPAVLALIGGLNVYVFGSETKNRVLVGYCTTVFVLMIFYGSQTGGYFREATREDRLRALSEQELRIKTFRSILGLNEDMPSWVVLSEPK